MKLTDEEITLLYNRDYLVFARTIEARVLEELRKQEPVAWIRPSDEGYDSAFRDHSTIVSCTGNDWKGWKPLYAAPIPPRIKDFSELRDEVYAAPIPPDNHDWKAEYLRQVDLHNQTLDELREAEMQLRNPAPTPPTPTPIQQEALMRVNLIGTPAEVIPMDRDLLRDFILARPDTEGSKP